jgi:hypothetical protein
MNTTTTYYRTGKGSKRHASVYCANSRRSVSTGDPVRLTADEAAKWAPCRFCCTAEEVAAFGQAPAAAKAPADPAGEFCANTGVMRPGSRRLRDRCKDCGKEGAVNRKTGTLRQHLPAAA